MVHTTSTQYKYYSALMAFVIWGGWAFYVNDYSGLETQLVSGFVQGTASFVITLVMVGLITKIFNYLPNNISRLILSPIITVCLTSTGLVLVHTLVGTQKIVLTITPALSMAFLFAVVTTLKLNYDSKLKGY